MVAVILILAVNEGIVVLIYIFNVGPGKSAVELHNK
jgi:hypothetical protein